MSEEPKERIAKMVSRAGGPSRRETERLIAAGKVAVNGVVIDTPACKVDSNDRITINGKPLSKKEDTRLWLYHKPPGLLVTHKDEESRTTIYHKLPKELAQAKYVGRLDADSEGLLLLTNDGELARYLTLPASQIDRHYLAYVSGAPNKEALAGLKNGITIDGFNYGPLRVVIHPKEQGEEQHVLGVSLQEGKNREVRIVLEHVGSPVTRLIRTSYGPFYLGALGEGEVQEVPTEQVQALLTQMKRTRNSQGNAL